MSYVAAATGRKNATHGLSGTPTYVCWQNIRHRCEEPHSEDYPDYGGRGIAVCARWQIFENFLEDMGIKPGRSYSIERENTDGNYEPGNCRWATAAEQSRNKRNNVFLTVGGRTMCMTDWAKEKGIAVGTMCTRLKRGWTAEEAVNTPPSSSNKLKSIRK